MLQVSINTQQLAVIMSLAATSYTKLKTVTNNIFFVEFERQKQIVTKKTSVATNRTFQNQSKYKEDMVANIGHMTPWPDQI